MGAHVIGPEEGELRIFRDFNQVEVMALMLGLHEKQLADGPFLVVSPTTVLNHGKGKMDQHVPGLMS